MASVSTKVVWKGDQVQAAILRGLDGGLTIAGQIVLAEVRRLILETPKTGRIYGTHQASAPGESPANETGALLNGLQVVNRGNQYSRSIVIVSADGKSSLLEFGTRRMLPRPYMTPALNNTSARVYAAIGGNIRTETAYSPGA